MQHLEREQERGPIRMQHLEREKERTNQRAALPAVLEPLPMPVEDQRTIAAIITRFFHIFGGEIGEFVGEVFDGAGGR